MAIAPSPWQDSYQAPLVALAAAITPALTWRDGPVLLLDVKGSLQWLGGIRGLKRRAGNELDDLGIHACIAMAPTAPGAWLLAINSISQTPKLRWRYALSLKRLSSQLDALPFDRLPGTQPYIGWLHQLGCHQLGHLRALDRIELAARTSPSLLRDIDQAYGQAAFTYEPLKLEPQFNEHFILPYLVEHTAGLEPYLKRLLQKLCVWLKHEHMAITQLECRLHHRDRRRAWPPTVLMLAVSQPSSDHAVLWRWLQLRLERIKLLAPVSDIGLLSRTLTARCERNLLLFADDYASHHTAHETLDMLRARLGATRVRQTTPQADYRPERTNHWHASDQTPKPIATTLSQGPHCPAWLLPSPKRLRTHQDQPQLEGPLRLLQGPYRVESGWWDDNPVLRDYFVATDQSNRRYWIYRERDGLDAHWFLHGLFG